MSQLICQRCGGAFDQPHRRGPVPKWCSPACRQRAYELRRLGRVVEETIAAALAEL